MSQKQVEYLFKYISQKWQTKLSHKDVGQSCDILQRFEQQRPGHYLTYLKCWQLLQQVPKQTLRLCISNRTSSKSTTLSNPTNSYIFNIPFYIVNDIVHININCNVFPNLPINMNNENWCKYFPEYSYQYQYFPKSSDQYSTKKINISHNFLIDVLWISIF